jgi:hypothetical protein
MTIREVELKRRMIKEFNAVTALYTMLKSNPTALRAKQVLYRSGEIDPLPIDFAIDVEIKAKRLLGAPIYLVFLRAVFNENLEIMPEYVREALGREWLSYGLGPDGAYRKLFEKENHGRATNTHTIPLDSAGIESEQFD